MEVVVLLLALLLYAFFNSVEAAVVAAGRLRVRHLALQGNRAAQALERLWGRRERFFAAVLLLQNFFIIAAASVATALAIRLAGEGATIAATVIMTVLVAVFGEMVPKVLGIQAGEGYALLVARPVETFIRLISPVVTLFAFIPSILARRFGGERQAPLVTEEELRALIEMSARDGTVGQVESDLLGRVFEFRDRLAHEVMVPRTEIVWLERGTRLRDFYRLFQETAHSRFPVYEGGPDNVVGVVTIKDILQALARGEIAEDGTIDSYVRPSLFVPETKPVGDLFWEMQRQGQRMALVVDEYGGIAGLVTLEMLLEEMVGELVEEGERAREYEPLVGGALIVEGGMSLHDASRDLGLAIPEGRYETMAGFVLSRLGHIPSEGEHVVHDGWRITVVQMQGTKVEKLLLTRSQDESSETKSYLHQGRAG
ncbi:MAG TPA: hemolysin family protein [Dehalococcoidia bacterium]|nr:hemolysin family protein [Dehalococcoidia bacterium]